MKKILFVINTLGGAGAETALVELLNSLDKTKYDISLYVLMGQGELVDRIPEHVCLLNRKFSSSSVLSREGRRNMIGAVLKAFWRNGHMAGKTAYVFRTLFEMRRNGNVQPDKILWRVMAEGGERFSDHYDLAVAYLEGGAAYYVADEVSAKRKAALSILIMRAQGTQRKWTGTATRKWTESLRCPMKSETIFSMSIRNMRTKRRCSTISSIRRESGRRP